MKKLLQLVAVAAFVSPMLAFAHGPSRVMAKEEITIKAPPAKVWAVIKDFGGLAKWHPAVKSCTMKDEHTRVCTLKSEGNPTITEYVEKNSDKKMMQIYKITDMTVVKKTTFNGEPLIYHTLPVANYKAWLSVKPVDGGSKVTWMGKFYREYMLNPPVPKDQSDEYAIKTMNAVYKQGLENLKKMLEK